MSNPTIKNTLEQAILTEIAKAPSTGYELIKLLPINTGWKASHQQIYRQCNRMAEDGILAYRDVPNEGKPDAKQYRLTKKGKALLNEVIDDEQFKLDTFRNKSTVMLAAGSVSYFVSASEVLSLAVNNISKRLKELGESMSPSSKVEQMNLELELSHKKADLDFAIRAKDMLCAK